MELNDRQSILPYVRSRRDYQDPPNIVHLLNARQIGVKYKTSCHMKHFAELKATVSEMKETHCELPATARSTFLMSFSHDCSKVASTHGDHNVYVSDVQSGKHLQKLEGHPRTPWCISFHPTSNDILASGCLAGQVRVWDLHIKDLSRIPCEFLKNMVDTGYLVDFGGSEKWRADNDQVIASLTFHPFLQMLVIATGNCLYFWDWSQPKPSAFCSTNSEIERVRYVKFDHYGHRLITGISNMGVCSSGNSWMSANAENCASNQNIFSRQAQRGERLRRHNDDTFLPGPTSSLNRSLSHGPQHPDMQSNRFGNDYAFDFRHSLAQQYRRTVERTPGRDSNAFSRNTITSSSTSPPVFYPNFAAEQEQYLQALGQNIARLAERNEMEETSHNTVASSSSDPRSLITDDDSLYDHVLRRDNGIERGRMRRRGDHMRPLNNLTSSALHDPQPSNTQSDRLPVNSTSSESLNEEDVRRIMPQYEETSNNTSASCSRAPSLLLTNNDSLEDYEVRRRNDMERIRSGMFRRNKYLHCPMLQDAAIPHTEPIWSESSDDEVEIIMPQSQNTTQAAGNKSAVNFRNKSRIPPIVPPSVSSITNSNSADRMNSSLPSTSGDFGVENTIESLFYDEHPNSNVTEETQVELGPENFNFGNYGPFLRLRSLCCDFSRRLIRNVYYQSQYEENASPSASENVSGTASSGGHMNENSVEYVSSKQYSTISKILTQIQAILDSASSNSHPANSRCPPPADSSRSLTIALRDKINKVCAKVREVLQKLRFWTGTKYITHYHRKLFEEMSVQFTAHLESLNETDSSSFATSSDPLVQETSNRIQALNRYLYLSAASSSRQSPNTTRSSGQSPNSTSPSGLFLNSTRFSEQSPNSTRSSGRSPNSIRSSGRSSGRSPNSTQSSEQSPNSTRSSRLSQNQVTITLNDSVVASSPIAPGRSVSISARVMSQNTSRRSLSISVQNNSQNASGTPVRIQDRFPSHRYNPLVIARNFRRNFNPSSPSNRPRRSDTSSHRSRRQSHSVVTPSPEIAEVDDESFLRATIRSLPRLSLAARRRFAIFYADEDPEELQEEEEQEPPESWLSLSSLLAAAEPISDNSSDESERPVTPQQLMYSPSYASWLFNGNSRMALGDPLTQNHRIQIWNFSPYKLPEIYDGTANIVVRRCMIHNDASVDISQDGEKLVALIPPENKDPSNDLMFGVFSLRSEDLGRSLCVWGYISNAISVSFSPLANYVVVGSAYSRPIFSNPEKTTVAQIVKIHDFYGSYDASYVRSFTQLVNNENRFQQVSLNCVTWIPQPGLGIAYATNRGCLSICKPTAGEIFGSLDDEADEDERIPSARIRIFRYLLGSDV